MSTSEFYTKLAGVTYANPDGTHRQDLIEDLEEEFASRGPLALQLRRDPGNPYDSNAVAVFDPSGRQLGFLSHAVAEGIAPLLDQGVQVVAEVAAVTGGGLSHNYGVNIRISYEG